MKKNITFVYLLTLSVLFNSVLCDEDHEDEHKNGFTKKEAWGIGFTLSVLVSCLGFLMALAMIPILKSKKIS